MAAYRRVYDSRHQQTECQEPGSATEPYARQSSMDYHYVFILSFGCIVCTMLDRPGLRGVELIEKLQSSVSRCLQSAVASSHPTDPSTFAKLLIKVSDLRTLNTIHSEKLLGMDRHRRGWFCTARCYGMVWYDKCRFISRYYHESL